MKYLFFTAVFLFQDLIMQAQNVGIGITTPVARLHVADSSVLFSALNDIPATPGNPPVSGTGRRLMWYADKAAFRAGYANGTEWNQSNIGVYSFATGNSSKAAGNSATALGYYSIASGDYSFAAGSSEAVGNNSVAIGSSYAGSAYSTSIGTSNSALGYASTAFGFTTIASADYSTSLGYTSTASGDYSTSLGVLTTASGNSSFSAGILSKASGSSSVAAGYSVFARALGGVSLGLFNDSTDNPEATVMTPLDRIFQLGNGSHNSQRKNAITVLRNANTGIGTVLPLARLHVADSSVLFSANGLALPSPGNPPVSGEGRRMMWYADKAAFRAGYIDGTQWNKDNVGQYSFASGYNPKASGFISTAMGFASNATSDFSTAMGYNTTASGYASATMGNNTTASGDNSTALGFGTKAKAVGSLSIGKFNDDTDSPSPNTPAPSDRIFQVGNGDGVAVRSNAVTVLKNGNTGIGIVNPNALLQLANTITNRKIVLWETANNDHQFYGFGINGSTLRYQTPSALDAHVFYSGASTTASTELFRINGNGNVGVGISDPAFRLDVGDRMRIRSTPGNSAGVWLNSDDNITSPAFVGMKANDEVGFYGQTGTAGWRFYVNTTTGNAWMQGSLTQNSDMRLKKDISLLQDPLQKIIQLHGYNYHWKNENADSRLQTGVLAQEVQKLFPELVSENKEGILAVNYSGLIPVMIESIKEQQKQIDELKKLVEKFLSQ